MNPQLIESIKRDKNKEMDDCTKVLIDKTNYTGHSLLHWAANCGDLEMCKRLILEGYIVDKQDSFGTTPLMLAAYNGFTDIVLFLLASGADSNIRNAYGADSLSMASANSHTGILNILQSYHQETTNEETTDAWPQHPVITSSAFGAKASVKFHYKRDNSCIHETNPVSGMNALMLAEAGGFDNVKDTLLEWGAKRNEQVKEFNPAPFRSPDRNSQIYFSLNVNPSSEPNNYSCLSSPLLYSFLSNSPNCLSPIAGRHVLTSDTFPPTSNSDHPLTPNLCFSPKKRPERGSFQKRATPLASWFKKLKRRRSRSLENTTKIKRRRSSAVDNDNILDYILSTAKLSEYKKVFESQEITFRMFLTLNEDDLIQVGIKKPKVKKKFLNLIHHYRRIFNSQI